MYGIARWYMFTQPNTPMKLGASFIADYADYLGVDPHQTMNAMISDLGVRRFRLVSYWNDIEPRPGHYDFSELDWEFAQANKSGSKVTLAIGLRQPRWPECHPPSWVNTKKPWHQWYPELAKYVTKVVNRYKDNPALVSYQLENEFLLTPYGKCHASDRQRLIREFQLVKKLDPHHKIILSSAGTHLWLGKPTADEFAVSIYRRTWDKVTNHYLTKPLPAWYYSFLAGSQEILTGRNTIIHELQAEPWPAYNKPIPETTLAEQNKTFTASDLKSRVRYAESTRMPSADLWGAPYWYYRKVKLHDPTVWQAARQIFHKHPKKTY
jgi:hypothetical protein